MGLQILVSVWFQVWVFVSIWYVFGKKVQNRVWSWWISCYPLRESEKKLLLRALWQVLFDDGIYATGTVRSNRKHMPTLKTDKQVKRGEHDWLACDTIWVYLWVFFDFLDISVVNSKTMYEKNQSTSAMSSMDFWFSLARSKIGTFINRKRAIPTWRTSKRSKGEIAMVHLRHMRHAIARARLCTCLKH